jgi:branched-chain amino acid transport system ATP-binding protein
MTAALEVEGISKSYGGVAAVRDVSFQVAAGEIVALIGPNGAGKSTCFNMIMGQIPIDDGTIRIFGRVTTGLPPRVVWRRGVGRTFRLLSTFYRFAGAMAREEAERLLDLLGLKPQAERACGELAYGDLKRLELAVALANDPKLLLLDEPTAGMAPRERVDLMALTARIARDRNIGVFFTEHDMDVVFEHADRVMVLDRGFLIAAGPPRAVRTDPKVRAVYLGESFGDDDRRREGDAT